MISLVSRTLSSTSAEESDNPVGGAICCSFIVFGGISVLVYRPWRNYIERKRQHRSQLHTEGVRTESDMEDEPRSGSYPTSDQNKRPKFSAAPDLASDNLLI